MIRYRLIPGAVACVAISLSARIALAEQAAPGASNASAASAENLEEVVVTGSLIRGVAPTGSGVISVSQADIAATGASNTAQVLAHIPEVTTAFNSTPAPGSGPLQTISRPDIRHLNSTAGGFGAGGNTTLVLIDGHKIVGAGTTFETPDPDVIPTAVLERVEVVTDGGSSIYGADAVGGVINYITKKKFDGVQVSLRGGRAANYGTTDLSLTGGDSWSSGSAFASYTFAKHDALYGSDRSYVHSLVAQSGACYPGTVTANGVKYLASTFSPGSSQCDAAARATIYPSETRHSIFAGFNQQLASALELDIKAFYTSRDVGTAQDPNFRNNVVSNATITSTNPYYRALPGDTGTQQVSFSYQGVADTSGRTQIKEWGITPTFKLDLGDNWQARLIGNYGQSKTTAYEFILTSSGTSAALAQTSTATALDPYDLTKTNASVFNNIFARNYQESTQKMVDTRLVVDGSIFKLPGGDAKVAVGGEFTRNTVDRGANASLTKVQYDAGDYSSLIRGSQNRSLTSVFGELSLPLLPTLTASASARYDHYSDFGNSTNPKIGLSFKPVDGFTLRGSYGTSFTAPALVDMTTVGSFIFARPASPFVAPNAPAGSNARPTIFVLGGNPTLQAQTATTWSFGTDIKPTSVPGLSISATYYNVLFKKQIGLVPFTNPSVAFASYYSNYVMVNPTPAQIQSIASQVQSILGPFLAGFPNTVAGLLAAAAANPPYAIIDTRKANLGQLKVNGIDFNARYAMPTSFGEVNFGAAGTYTLSRQFAPAAGASFVDQFVNPGSSRLYASLFVGAKAGAFDASLVLNHSDGYSIPANTYVSNGFVPSGTQTSVAAFNVLDLSLAYALSGGPLDNTQLSLTINNVLKASPPFDSTNVDAGYGNGATLGRLVQLGVTKKF